MAHRNETTKLATRAMLSAVHGSDLDKFRAAVALGAHLSDADEDGRTALIIAASRGDARWVRLILSLGAHPDGGRGGEGPDGVATALMAAASAEVVYRHDNDGPDPWDIKGTMSELIKAKADVGRVGSEGETALILAAWSGDADRVELLLAAGADVSLADHDGLDAAMHAVKRGQSESLEALLGAGADPGKKFANGDSLLIARMGVWETGEERCAQLLIKAGAPLNDQDAEGCTAAMRAAEFGRVGLLRELAEAGADLLIRDRAGSTAFEWAKRGGRQACMDVLRPIMEAQAERAALAIVVDAGKGAALSAPRPRI